MAKWWRCWPLVVCCVLRPAAAEWTFEDAFRETVRLGEHGGFKVANEENLSTRDYRVLYGTKPVAIVPLHWYYDANENGRRDADEKIQEQKVTVRYGARIELNFLRGAISQAPDKDGVLPRARQWFDRELADAKKQGQQLAPVTGCGDFAAFGEALLAPNPVSNEHHWLRGLAVRGPFTVEVKVFIDGFNSDRGPDENDPEFKLVGANRLDADEYNKQVPGWRAGRQPAAVDLVRALLRAWDAWYLQPVAGGPGSKGLFNPDTRAYWLRAGELPAGLAVDRLDAEAEPNYLGGGVYIRRAGEQQAERYVLSYQFVSFESSQTPDYPLRRAHEAYVRTRGELKRPEPLDLPGADEATRMLWRDGSNYEVVTFRYLNAMIIVRGDVNAPQLAPTRAVGLAKRVLAKLKGLPVNQVGEADDLHLQLTATPALLWADGQSRAKLALQAASAGQAVSGLALALKVDRGGTATPDAVETDAAGAATAEFRPTYPGVSTITVSVPGRQVSCQVGVGGLSVAAENPTQTRLLADGQTSTVLVVRAQHPSGQPLAGVAVKLAADDQAQPVRGSLSARTVTTGADGSARVRYTAPKLAPNTGVGSGTFQVTGEAQVGNPPRTVRGAAPLALEAPLGLQLTVAKMGYAPLGPVTVAVAPSWYRVRGQVAAKPWPAGAAAPPVAFADVRLTDRDGRTVTTARTDAEGRFDATIADRQPGRDSTGDLVAPLLLGLDPAAAQAAKNTAAALQALAARQFSFAAGQTFLDAWPALLARSQPGAAAAQQSTEYALSSLQRLGLLALYVKLTDERQSESLTWMIASLKDGLKQICELLAVTDKLDELAAEKLGEHYLPESWKKLQRQILLKLAMKVMAQVKLGFESVKALGIELDMPSLETTEALLDLALEHRKTVLDLGVGYVQDYVVAAVKDTLTPWFHQRNQALLTAALERLAKGDAPRDETGFERAKQLFTTYEAQHNALNLAHLDKDLYRLDAKLVLDTVAKGALLYVGVKEILSPATWLKLKRLDLKSLNDIQKKIVEQAELTDKVGQALDTAFDSYQGYRWIADALSAGRTLEQVTKALLP